jgi:hypothetical protein
VGIQRQRCTRDKSNSVTAGDALAYPLSTETIEVSTNQQLQRAMLTVVGDASADRYRSMVATIVSFRACSCRRITLER